MKYPLQPLSPIQRLGWLQHFSQIRCTRAFALFERGQLYPLETSQVRMTQNGVRLTREGGREAVIYTGIDLLIKVGPVPGGDVAHRFLATPQTFHPWIHDLSFLVAHFQIPEIPDQASLQPAAFAEFQRRLHALES